MFYVLFFFVVSFEVGACLGHSLHAVALDPSGTRIERDACSQKSIAEQQAVGVRLLLLLLWSRWLVSNLYMLIMVLVLTSISFATVSEPAPMATGTRLA